MQPKKQSPLKAVEEYIRDRPHHFELIGSVVFAAIFSVAAIVACHGRVDFETSVACVAIAVVIGLVVGFFLSQAIMFAVLFVLLLLFPSSRYVWLVSGCSAALFSIVQTIRFKLEFEGAVMSFVLCFFFMTLLSELVVRIILYFR